VQDICYIINGKKIVSHRLNTKSKSVNLTVVYINWPVNSMAFGGICPQMNTELD
jgi:hypothetical protein